MALGQYDGPDMGAKMEGQPNLRMAVTDLEETVSQLVSLAQGTPMEATTRGIQGTAPAADVIDEVRNRVNECTARLRQVGKTLERV